MSLSSRRSLGAIANIALVGACLALVVGSATVGVAFANLAKTRDRTFNALQPALVETQRLRSSMVEQAAGIGGYAVTREPRILDPYLDGKVSMNAAVAALRSEFSNDPTSDGRLEGALSDVLAEHAKWSHTIADVVLAAPVAPDVLDSVLVDSSRSFDRVLDALDRFERTVEDEHSGARGRLDAATKQLLAAVITAMALLTIAGFGGVWLIRRWVLRPLAELVDAADSVALGEFDKRTAVRGPKEIEHLATRVDQMRARIVAELATVEAARCQLDAKAEELARSNNDLEQFAYVASHDLQEPLRKVASFCQLLEQRYGDELDERARTYIHFAVDGAKRMQELINDLLEFSRVGRTTDRFRDCDLGEIVAEVVDRVTDVIGNGRVVAGDLPVVKGDASLYTALIQNLIGNSIKYRRAGVDPVVRFDAERRGAEWVFTCVDNGIGIDSRYRERVFMIFQRLHGRDEYAGTGIGLALCRRIVEFSGGHIWVADAPEGEGTSVCWTLPVRPEDGGDAVLARPRPTVTRWDASSSVTGSITPAIGLEDPR